MIMSIHTCRSVIITSNEGWSVVEPTIRYDLLEQAKPSGKRTHWFIEISNYLISLFGTAREKEKNLSSFLSLSLSLCLCRKA